MIVPYISNDLNELFKRFVEVVDRDNLAPLEPEIVVVQTDGIKKWLSLNFAQSKGICCNVEYLSPKKVIYNLLSQIGLNFNENYLYEKENLFWLILNIISKSDEDFGPLSKYIRDIDNSDIKNDEVKLAQIAAATSDLFDQYFTYRPQLIDNWEKGSKKYVNNEKSKIDEEWQFNLFSRIKEKIVEKTLPTQIYELLDKKLNNEKQVLYKRINFFAISVLPPFYIFILNKFAPYLDIYLYLLNPSSDFWYEDISEKAEKKIALTTGKDVEEQYYSVKKGILTDFGKLGRDFFINLISGSNIDINQNECFIYNECPNDMLSIIKEDILLNKDTEEKIEVNDNDYSIEIHSCHSPMREVEVLYNRLLNIFENNKGKSPGDVNYISPNDILIMTPDISEYAPYVEAVFSKQKKNEMYIPYSISDVNYMDESSFIKIFMDILKLVRGRYSASEIFNLIEFEGIRKKFKLSETDINLLRICINESGIRWGLDAAHREEEGLEQSKIYSWEFGIERLLLSLIYEKDDLYNNILTVKGIGTSSREAVYALVEFINIINELYSYSKDKHCINEWYRKLTELIGQIFEVNTENLKDFKSLIFMLENMSRSYKVYVIKNPPISVGIDFIIEYLKGNMKDKRQSYKFLDGNLNFCEMIPMRSIPFKVICIIGLNDDTFPRKRKPLSFDLIAQDPMRGDRNLRENDKYLFLETIISASQKLYLSYVGQDIITNDELPPSALITQFLYNIKRRFKFSDENIKIEDSLINKHPLFSFNEKYFMKNGSDMFINYSEDDFIAVKSKKEGYANIESRIKEKIEVDNDLDDKIININDLMSFFGNPIEYFFRRTLGINLDDRELSVEDKEPFNLGIDEYNIKSSIIENFFNEENSEIAGHNIKSYIFKYTGLLPPGGIGSAKIKELISDGQKFFVLLKQNLDTKSRKIYEVAFDLNDYRIEGVLKYFHRLHNNGGINTSLVDVEDMNLVYYRPTGCKTKDKIYTWVKHVIFNYFEIINGKKPSNTYFFGLEKQKNKDEFIIDKLIFKPNDENQIKEQLNFIISTYLRGIKEPLHFYPEVSEEYFNNKEKEKDNYIKKFSNYIEDSQYGYDKKDNYLVFYMKNFGKKEDFFDEDFSNLADIIFGYISKNCMEMKC